MSENLSNPVVSFHMQFRNPLKQWHCWNARILTLIAVVPAVTALIPRGMVTLGLVYSPAKKRETEVEVKFWKLQVNKTKTLKQNWSLYLSFNTWKKYVPSTFVFLTPCNFSLISITLRDICNFILDCSVSILVFLLPRNLPPLPRRCGCCSKCCYQPGLSCWPFLLSDSHSPTRTSLWRARLCSAWASNRLLWSHPGYSECCKTVPLICICTDTTNKLTAPW